MKLLKLKSIKYAIELIGDMNVNDLNQEFSSENIFLCYKEKGENEILFVKDGDNEYRFIDTVTGECERLNKCEAARKLYKNRRYLDFKREKPVIIDHSNKNINNCCDILDGVRLGLINFAFYFYGERHELKYEAKSGLFYFQKSDGLKYWFLHDHQMRHDIDLNISKHSFECKFNTNLLSQK